MKKILILALALMASASTQAQNVEGRRSLAERAATPVPPAGVQDTDHNLLRAALKGWHVSVGAGVELGGTSPLPLPRSIRHINSFNPMLNLSIEGAAHKSFTPNWGLSVGLRLEQKGMKTNADVKNYHMKITESTVVTDPATGAQTNRLQTMEGGWTGSVVTKVNNIYLTIPILATYTFCGERWTLNAGPYLSFRLHGGFEGHVYDGYIRTAGNTEGTAAVPDELGENVDVTYATYDFGSDQRIFAWGLQVGASYRAYKHLYVNANLDWGLNSVFPDDFKTITFGMYPIYGTLGFSYRF